LKKNVQVPDRERIHRKEYLRFAVLFLLVIVGFYALTLSPWVDAHVLLPVLQVSAEGASFVINLLGGATKLSGVIIQGPDFSVAVRRGCDPLEPIVLFGAAVLAFRSPVRRKILGFVFGASLLFGINLLRITTLYAAGRARVSCFNALHQEWWPAFYIVVTILIWLAWLQWLRKERGVNEV
jgi:exosortase H (IPTLxxWG-CTERM-specific)